METRLISLIWFGTNGKNNNHIKQGERYVAIGWLWFEDFFTYITANHANIQLNNHKISHNLLYQLQS